jgi:two-component system, chemotaxis family, sensor kinase CheA
MTNLDELKRTFFEECNELLQEIETGLTDMREGTGSEDTVHAVFRGVHSVKGGAGIFGFEPLVEFAHVFETVLDAVRQGSMESTSDVIDVLLAASDVLSDMVTLSRAGEPIAAELGGECRAALERLIGAEGAAKSEATAPADFAGIDFVPIRADDFEEPPEQGRTTYAITFRPKPEMLKNANEPLYILRELRRLGELDLVAETDALPPLPELQPDHPYIGWTGTLRTNASRQDIDAVFEFVVGDCVLEIVEIAAAAEVAPVADEPIPLVPGMEDAVTAPVEPIVAAISSAVAGTARATEPPPEKVQERVQERPQEKVQDTFGEAAETNSANSIAKPAATTTRVDLEKIDRVVNLVGELVIAQAMLGQVVQGLPEDVSGLLTQALDEVIHHTRELKDRVMSMRAQPVSSVFRRMPRLVRELSMKTAKKVRIEMSGENTEVDRTIVERLSDPLTHIIRNAVDHGIESPSDRLAAGKSEEGLIHLAADHRGGRIVIEIRDDGAGIDHERVLRKAREKGLVDPEATLTDDEISNLIFLPGFSTADTISDISGRGVGMDVVRRNIQDLGGRISLKSQRGRGMTIQLALPLTLAVMDGMVIKCGRETYVTPMSSIVECLRPARTDVHKLLGTRGMLQLRGNLVPIVHLGDLLDVASEVNDLADGVVIITEAGEGTRFGLVVDELCGHQQVVIKSIEESYGAVPGIAAATILGNGRVAFILDVEKLSDLAADSSPQIAAAASAGGTSAAAALASEASGQRGNYIAGRAGHSPEPARRRAATMN